MKIYLQCLMLDGLLFFFQPWWDEFLSQKIHNQIFQEKLTTAHLSMLMNEDCGQVRNWSLLSFFFLVLPSSCLPTSTRWKPSSPPQPVLPAITHFPLLRLSSVSRKRVPSSQFRLQLDFPSRPEAALSKRPKPSRSVFLLRFRQAPSPLLQQ